MLQKQSISMNFGKGLDLKTDPWQVPFGNFLELTNQVFNKGNRLTKRNGFGALSALPSSHYSYLTTFSENLTAVGPSIAALNTGNETWVTKGTLAPMAVSTLPLIRNSQGQIQCDSAIAANGLVCTVYTQSSGGTLSYLYVIADSKTGQNIVEPTPIPLASGAVTGGLRVFVVGIYFVLGFTNLISSTSHLQYVVLSSLNPTVVSPNLDLAASYIPAPTIAWDAAVFGTTLYASYNTTAGGQAIAVTYLTLQAIASAFTASPIGPVPPASFAGSKASLMSVCVDSTVTNPFIYVSFFSLVSGNSYTLVVDTNLNTILAPAIIQTGGGVLNLASAAQNGTCTVFGEFANSYGYDATIPTHYIASVSITPLGIVFNSIFSSGASTITASSATGLADGMFVVDNTTPANIADDTTFTISGTTLTLSNATAGNSASSPGDVLAAATLVDNANSVRSVGLASKAFIIDGTIYFLAAFESPYQSTYFLINGSLTTEEAPIVAAKLAYENGGGYLTLGLPSVTLNGSTAQFPYLFKDLIETIAPAADQTIGLKPPVLYTQTGVNLGTLDFGAGIDTAETGSNLHLSGGFLWAYDGFLPVEHNYFLWPDSVEVETSTSSLPITGTVTNGSFIITATSSTGSVAIGMTIAGTDIPSGTVVVSFTANTVTMSAAATGNHGPATITLYGNINGNPTGYVMGQPSYYVQAIYEWTDNQGNSHKSAPSIPTPIFVDGSSTDYKFLYSVPTLRLTYKIQSPVKIRTYRWSVQNPVYYETTSIIYPTYNDTTVDYVTILDAQIDSAIVGNNIIYTTGGVVEDVNAPATNLITIFDVRLWLVDAEDQNLLWFSKQVIEAVPVEMSDLLTYYVAPSTAAQGPTGPITAIAPIDDKLIVFKRNAIYYINGTGPDNLGNGSQYSQPIFITAVVGCANQQSIVFTPAGLMFQSGKGIWLLGRDLSTSYVGAPVEDFNASLVQSAVNVPDTNQVRFTLNTGEQLMYDYYYGQWGVFEGASAISSCVYGDLHTIINAAGQVLQETPGLYLDGENPVLLGFTTSWIQLAALQGYQRFYYFYFLGEYLSPHKMRIELAYNFVDSFSQSSLIAPKNFSSPVPSGYGEQPSPYGSPTSLEQWKIFAKVQKCQSFKIKLTEIFDPSLGVGPGAGFTMSGLNMTVAMKRGVRPIRASNTVG